LRPLAAVTALCLVAVVAGCGGDNGGSKPASTTSITSRQGTTAGAPSNGATGDKASGGSAAGSGATSGNAGGPVARTPTARRRLIQRADKRCRARQGDELRTERRLAQLLTHISPQQSPQTARVVGQEIELLRSEQAQIESLAVPASDRPKLRRLLQAYAQRIAQLSGLRSALLRRDLGGALTLSTRSTPLKALQRSAAKNFGFKVCGVARVGPPIP
jgi:hypothetical protein